MKKLFIINYYILVLDWLPMLFLCLFAINFSQEIQFIIFVLGIAFLIFGSMGFLLVSKDSDFWRTKEELDEIKNILTLRIKEYEEAKQQLINHVLRDSYNLSNDKKLLEAKILNWYAKNRDEDFAKLMGINSTREGKIN